MLHAQAPQRLALVFRELLKLARTVRMATRREADVETRSVNLNPARDYLLNFPPRCWRSRLFSQAFSMTSDFWITFHGGGEALTLGTPWGKQFANGSSPECDPSARWSTSALAQG